MGILDGFRRKKPSEDVEERLERLEKALKQIEIEWTDTYDKFRRLHMRVAKQAQRLDAAQVEVPEGDTGGERETPTSSGGLTPHQMTMQDRILARRRRLVGG